MIKLVIDAGHGGHDSGAVWNHVQEKDIALSVSNEVYELLCSECIVLPTRVTDRFIPVDARAIFANQHDADLFISIHCNADPDPDGPGDKVAKGEEIWVHPSSGQGRKFAELMQKYTPLFASTHRGIKVSTALAVLHLTKMPAVLMEVGFVDDPSFAMMPPIQDIVLAIASGVRDWIKKESS